MDLRLLAGSLAGLQAAWLVGWQAAGWQVWQAGNMLFIFI